MRLDQDPLDTQKWASAVLSIVKTLLKMAQARSHSECGQFANLGAGEDRSQGFHQSATCAFVKF